MSNLKVKYRTLVQRLYHLTAAKVIAWQFDQDTASCHTKIGDKVLTLSIERNDAEDPIAVISLINAEGALVETFNDEAFSGEPTGITGIGGYWTLMNTLFDMAKSQALGVGKDLDEVLEQLDDMLPF